MTAATVTTRLAPMTREEARRACERVKSHLGDARSTLLELYQREGWRALGYASWRECATEEFGLGASHVYRLLTAAQVEADLGSPPGEIAEGVLRPLGGLDPDDRREAWRGATAAAGGGVPTAAQVEEARRLLLGLGLPAAAQAEAANAANRAHVAADLAARARERAESAAATRDRAVRRLRQAIKAFRKVPGAAAVVAHLEAASEAVKAMGEGGGA